MAETKTAKEIYETVEEEGRANLSRASLGLAFSGLSAGLNISLGALAMFSVAGMTGGVGLAAIAIYPLGFLVVVLGRTQLFTETTVTPVAVVLGVLSGKVFWIDYLTSFLIPAVLGNTIGGVFFVALLNYAQIIGSSKKTALAHLSEEQEEKCLPEGTPDEERKSA